MKFELKNRNDAIYNIISFAIFGVSGIAINIIIINLYGTKYLGVFNQAIAIYIFLSQIGSLGIQVSCLRHTAQYSTDQKELGYLITSALLLVTLAAFVVSLGTYLAAPLFSILFSSPDVSIAIVAIVPGIFFFCLTKVVFNVLNGLQYMRLYACFQAARYLVVLAALIVAYHLGVPGNQLTITFSIAEALLFFTGLLVIGRYIRYPANFRRFCETSLRHIRFGLKSLPGGISVELNSRVDVIMLGIFASDRTVGIYSFIALLFEGINQFPIVFRRIIDPIITKLMVAEDHQSIIAMIRKGKVMGLGGLAVIAVLAFSAYPFLAKIVDPSGDLLVGWTGFAILLVGSVIYGGYAPFSGILVQSGYPGIHTTLMMATLVTNATLNALLIPWYGLEGAATATSVAFILFCVYLSFLSRRMTGIAI